MDEFDYVLNAKYVYHTGRNIYNNWSPWSLKTVPNEVPKGELTYWVSFPFVGPFGLSLFTARIGFALISIATVFILYGISFTLFGPWVGMVTGFLAAINPWSIYFGRTAFDVPVSVMFYLLSLLCLLRLRGPKLLLTLIPLFLAFYNYIGTKLLFIPFIIVSTIGIWWMVRKKKDTKWYLLVMVGAFLLFVQFIIGLRSTSASLRMDQIFTPFYKDIASDVNLQRRLTLASPLVTIFVNKPMVYLKELCIKFFGAFNPLILFTNGEGLSTLSLWQHGLFYPIDALFLLVGSSLLLTYSPLLMLWFAILVGISTIPSVFSTVGVSYVHRSAFMYPIMIILMSYGIVETVRTYFSSYKKSAIVLITLIYIVLTTNFVYIYFFRFPYYNSESFGLSQRLYSRYTALASTSNIPVIHFTESPELYFRNYIFYRDLIQANTAEALRNQFIRSDYSWENTRFIKKCPTKEDIDKGDTVYFLSNTSPCKEYFINRPMTVIPSLSDGGTLYMIFNDKVCSNYALSSYPTGYTMDDLAVEKLPEKQFCERFVIRYLDPLYRPQSNQGNWITPEN